MKRLFALTFVFALVAAALGAGQVALAAAPSNDNFANATLVPTTGFVDMINTSEATLEPNEPNNCYPISNSVWYKFTAGTSSYNVVFDTTGSDYPAYQTLYLATADGLQLVGCYGASPIFVNPNPGDTWYVQVTGTPDGGTGGTTTTGATTTGGTTTTTGTTGTSTTDGSTTGGTTTTTGTTSTGGTTGTTTGTTGTSTGTTGTSTGTTTGGSVASASTTATSASGNLVFTATVVEIVPIDVTVTVGSSGSVNRAGTAAIVSGTITCSRAATATVDVYLTQIFAGRMVATGYGQAVLDCGPAPSSWSAEVTTGGPILFGAGNATADIYANVGDDHGSGFAQKIANVHLKRAK